MDDIDRPDRWSQELGPGGLEARGYPTDIRATIVTDGPTISGLGSVYNTSTLIEGWFSEWDEVVAPGAWATALEPDADVRSMFNHDNNQILGRTKAGTLRLTDRPRTGLQYDIDINPDDPIAMSVHAKVLRGDVSGSSVWFRVVEDRWEEPTERNGLERPKRTILACDPLYEVGPVVFPAFTTTTSTARAASFRGLGYTRRELDTVTGTIRGAGVTRPHHIAQHAARLLADPSGDQVRDLFTRRPDLRNVACGGDACSCQPDDGSAAATASKAADSEPDAGEVQSRTHPLLVIDYRSAIGRRRQAAAERFLERNRP